MHSRKTLALQTIAVGGGIASLITGVYALGGGVTSQEGTVAVVLLLLLSLSLGAALGIQALTYGRAARYAGAMSQVLRLMEEIGRCTPETMTGMQATAVCDRFVDDLAKIFCQICGAPCYVSIEILTPTRAASGIVQKRSTDYLVVNLSRDKASESLPNQHQQRHSIDGNTAYREIFQNPACGAHYLSDDVAAGFYSTTELKADELARFSTDRLRRSRWPLSYRSTLVTKICRDEPCKTQDEHTTIAFLWLRSPATGAFNEEFDVDLMRRLSKAISPVVTRCTQATKPTFDFRRPSAVEQELARPTSA